MSNNSTLITGTFGGKRVKTSGPRATAAYAELKKLAMKGNYWAWTAVSCLQGLGSGRIGKNNIFIHPYLKTRGDAEIFFVALPGCMATFERRTNDEYYMTGLDIDATYKNAEANQRTGLYKVAEVGPNIEATIYKNGKSDFAIGSNESRHVVVSSSQHEEANEAAKDCKGVVDKLIKAGSDLFDMHYTHGQGKVGGLLPYGEASNPTTIRKLNGSAILLARTMAHAKNHKKMVWVSEYGGSAVLTQALKILADQNIKLDGHKILSVNPTTSPNQMMELAYKLGMEPGRDPVSAKAFNITANSDLVKLVKLRKTTKEDAYQGIDYRTDLRKALVRKWGPTTVVGTIAGMAGFSIAGVLGASFPALAMAVGVISKTTAIVGVADKVAETVGGKKYDKTIGRIK